MLDDAAEDVLAVTARSVDAAAPLDRLERTCNTLNMSSSAATRSIGGHDDRSTRARIRDAAVSCFAEHGRSRTTARLVADAAGVSPGSVIHHFGTMTGLQQACDEHVAAVLRDTKEKAVAQGQGLDVLAALRDAPIAGLGPYLARMLVDEEAAAGLVDRLVDDAEGHLAQSEANGLVHPSEDPRARAIVLTVFSLGSLVLHAHVARLLGVDIADATTTGEDLMVWARPVSELYGEGLFTPEYAAMVRNALGPPDHVASSTGPSVDDATATSEERDAP